MILEGMISQRMSREPIKLQPKQVCNAIHGLQSMSSEYPEVRRLLGVLVELLEDSSPSASVRAMRDSQTDSQSDKQRKSREQYFTPRLMANALKGLQCMSCAHVDVRDAIRTIAEKLIDDEELLEQFRREHISIAVALASLKRIQAVTMQYSERNDCSSEGEQLQALNEPKVVLTANDRIPEKDRFRSYYTEARTMISLIHPHAVRDVNDGGLSNGSGSGSGSGSGRWEDDDDDDSYLDYDRY
jgi:hypothetical protein